MSSADGTQESRGEAPIGDQPYLDWDTPIDLGDIITLHTNYNLALSSNKNLIFKRNDKQNHWDVTEQERAYGAHCFHPKDLEQFKKKVNISIF